jgi:hypothetical protein
MSLPRDSYSYLLGVYLGDGCLAHNGGSWALRVALDDAYPGIVSECWSAIAAVRGEQRPPPSHTVEAIDGSLSPQAGAAGFAFSHSTGPDASITERSNSLAGSRKSSIRHLSSFYAA